MNELQTAVASGAYVAPTKMTVKAFLEDWLVSAKARLRPGAYDACELHVCRYINPRIGNVPLQALTRQRVQRLYVELTTSGRIRGDDGACLKRPCTTSTAHSVALWQTGCAPASSVTTLLRRRTGNRPRQSS